MSLPHVAYPTLLRTGSLVLRPPSVHDIDALYQAAQESIQDLRCWMPWAHEDYSRSDTTSYVEAQPQAWQNGEEYSFLIQESGSSTVLGCCGLNRFEWINRRANLGYWIRTLAAGRGIATRAAKLVAHFGFEPLQLQRIEIVAGVGNLASQRVAEKIGALRECIARNRCRVNEQPMDAVVYSLVPGDSP